MALALPLIVELLEPLQSLVEWLAGGPAPRRIEPAVRPAPAADRSPPRTRPVQASTGLTPRSWGGPMRADLAPRAARVVRVAAGGIVVSGRIDDVHAELDRLASRATTAHAAARPAAHSAAHATSH